MFIIGLYGVTREVMTTTFSWLSVLSELAMPFYLTHQQILVVIVAGASWYPHLSESLMKCQLSSTSGYICRIVPGGADPLHSGDSGGVLVHHQGGTSQIFLRSAHQTFCPAWKSPPRLCTHRSDEFAVCCWLRPRTSLVIFHLKVK